MKYFKIQEFACKCGCNQAKMQPCLLDGINLARGEAGIPFIVTSGYRCAEYNKKIGGVVDSAHTRGYAADIAINDLNKDAIVNALKKHFRRVGIASNFVHVDCDPDKPTPVYWTYNK